MEKKTRTLSVKVGAEFCRKVEKALGRTSAETVSRFLRGCLEDLVRADEAGQRIEEPVKLERKTAARNTLDTHRKTG